MDCGGPSPKTPDWVRPQILFSAIFLDLNFSVGPCKLSLDKFRVSDSSYEVWLWQKAGYMGKKLSIFENLHTDRCFQSSFVIHAWELLVTRCFGIYNAFTPLSGNMSVKFLNSHKCLALKNSIFTLDHGTAYERAEVSKDDAPNANNVPGSIGLREL